MTEQAKTTPKRRKPKRPTPKPKPPPRQTNAAKVAIDQVGLVPRSARKGKGDGVGGEYWEVQVDGKRAGEVFVNLIDEAPLGRHASLQIFLSKPQQGKGIGRIAYRMAADASRHDPIFLHMRKANIASRLAAEAAGFSNVSPPTVTQLILRRAKPSL